MIGVEVGRVTMMARKRTDRPVMESVKLPADVMESARIVAAYTGDNMAEMLGKILRPVLARMELAEAARRAKEKAQELSES